jgi:undecaprenyl-diphosphatase
VTASLRPDPAPVSHLGAPRPDPNRTAVARRVRRHPVDVLRVAVGAAVLAAVASAHGGRIGRLEADVARLVDDLPSGLLRPLGAVLQLGAFAAVPVAALAALAARRIWLARDLAAAGTLTWLLAKLLEPLVDGARAAGVPHAMPASVPAPSPGFPSSHVAVAAALATAAAPYLPRPARRAAWALVVLVGVAGVHAGGLLVVDALAGAALGWAVAGALHLLLGAPGAAPTAAVAAASPTPGGLGAMEAALVAGLTAVGAPTGPSVAGVLAFRLLTYWLPVVPGWLAYRALRADGTI